MHNIEALNVTSPAFKDGGTIPIQHTGFAADVSPALYLSPLHKGAVSIVVYMDDLDVPLIKPYNHWTLWNLPVMERIPEHIPYGPSVPSLGNARQGMGYGKNRYKGPKPPALIQKPHRYEYHVLVLDCMLELHPQAGKKELLKAVEGHILQHGCITGTWSNKRLRKS